ncbi:hypothetical protein I6J72_05820 [Corynebacterium sp. FDAARGOS 1242]|uniref:hypothetical protein n=1 Tax=Corynebacterium sp. FDAARGOS 1242 TaxID=2778078 RepID=UPI001950B309|nr:hypothetical protein [Corynebacterium sp. FDAARGOS 1242]QRP99017.1 hypothetical protein I6J72_05820 [Corynebacterium sp. FDAARGOS 1242]
MDHPSIDPHLPNDPDAPPESQETELPSRRDVKGFLNENLALRGSAILLGGWPLGLLSLIFADSAASGGDDAASYFFGFLGIFTLIGLSFAALFLAPFFAFIAIASLNTDSPKGKRKAIIAIVLSVASLIPVVAYFGPDLLS